MRGRHYLFVLVVFPVSSSLISSQIRCLISLKFSSYVSEVLLAYRLQKLTIPNNSALVDVSCFDMGPKFLGNVATPNGRMISDGRETDL